MSKPPYHLHHDAKAIEHTADLVAEDFITRKKKPPAKPKWAVATDTGFSSLTSLLPDVFKGIEVTLGALNDLIASGHIGDAVGHFGGLIGNTVQHWGKVVDINKMSLDGAMEAIGGDFVDSLTGVMGLGGGIGGEPGTDVAIKTIKRVVGFTALYTFAGAGLIAAAKLPLKDRVAGEVAEVIAGLSEKMGIEFFLGMVFNSIFEMATMKPLEEAINRKVKPNRLDFRVLKAALKQGHVSDAKFHQYMLDLGYPSDLEDLIKNLDKHNLGVSDLQQAYLNNVPIPGGFDGYMEGLGYSAEDTALVKAIYLDKTQTEAGATYRAAARSAFEQDFITESQFKTILSSINLPQNAIDLEIKAATLVKDIGKRHLSMGILKSALQDKAIDPSVAMQDLIHEGYTAEDADTILKIWQDTALTKHKSLPVSKILYYYAHKAISRQDAYNELIKLGYNDYDANLLIDNPSSKIGTANRIYTVSTLKAAYKDGLLKFDDFVQKRVEDGATEAEATLEAQVIDYSLDPSLHKRSHPKLLSVAMLHQLLKYDIEGPGFIHDYLVRLGYSDSDAYLILALFGYVPEGSNPFPIAEPPVLVGGPPIGSPIDIGRGGVVIPPSGGPTKPPIDVPPSKGGGPVIPGFPTPITPIEPPSVGKP